MRAVPAVHEKGSDGNETARSDFVMHGVVAVMCILGSVPQAARGGDAAPVRFSRDVLPILSENCLLCHGPDVKTRKADLRLDVKESALRSKDPIIVSGRSADSELIRRLETEDADELMPPPKSGRKLSKQQKETLKRWVDQGAVWGKHWAFEPPVRPELPPVSDAAWARNAIDRFVLARLEQEGLKPSPEADPATLLRRAVPRPDRAAADTRGRRCVPVQSISGRLRTAGGPAAGLASPWRADGARVA